MILVDDRSGSKELLKPLRAAGLPVELSRLHAADLAFEGKGVGGKLVSIGIEHKRLDSKSNDIVQSLRSGRLSGEQLPKMLGDEGIFDYAWVIIQGVWQRNPKGELTVYKGPMRGWQPVPGRMTENEFEKRLLDLDVCAGLHVRFTESVTATVRYVKTLYQWWTDKALDEHVSHLQIHVPQGIVPMSDRRKALCMWPGIGHKVSKAVLQHFRSIRRAAVAGPKEWAEIQTLDKDGNSRRLGMATASKIDAFLTGEDS